MRRVVVEGAVVGRRRKARARRDCVDEMNETKQKLSLFIIIKVMLRRFPW